MPFKDPEKAKEFAKQWVRNWRRNPENRKKHNEVTLKSYYKMRSDPQRLNKFLAYKRNYYHKNSKKIIEQQINYKFGGNRRAVINRDGRKCRICSSVKRIVVHHIDGKGQGFKKPDNSLNNLIVLCFVCHHSIHQFSKIKDNILARFLLDKLYHGL